MKKRIRVFAMVMTLLMVLSLTTIMGTSAAEPLPGNLSFKVQASFNSISVTPPQQQGDYIYSVYDREAGSEVADYLPYFTVGDLVYEDIDSASLLTETVEEYYSYDIDGNFDAIYPETEYYVIMFELDMNGTTGTVTNYGFKKVASPEAPEAYKGYEGFLRNTIDFEVIPGDKSITLEPIDDGGCYVAEIISGITAQEMEDIFSFIPAGALPMETGFMLTEEYSVSGIIDPVTAEPVYIEPNTDYLVCYFKLDSAELPANVITYGVKEVKTVESLDVYKDSETVKIITDGDANGDGVLNIKDATAIQKHIAKIDIITDEYQLSMSDTNMDDDINIKDATLIQKHLAKMDTGAYYLGMQYPVKK